MTVQLVGSDLWRSRGGALRYHAVPDWGAALGIFRLDRGEAIGRARSAPAVALLMIDGALRLSSYRGRERLERGMVAIRPSFDARAVRAENGGATWLQLPWDVDGSLGATHEIADVDRLLLCAAYDLSTARAEMAKAIALSPPTPVESRHWIDGLHRAMLADPHLSISGWARDNRISREAAARSFRAAYDVQPSRFRLELRARSAWARIVASNDSLSSIALEMGFADQSHMTRAVGWFTGRPPSAWRRAR